MEEIKVGEYIRTNSGTIAKLKRIEFDKADKDLKWYFYDKKEFGINIVKEECINKPYIVKHSPYIVDLIEKDDYVNGYKVKQVLNPNMHGDLQIICVGGEIRYAHAIKTIVTKEQFNQMKYIVGDESNEPNK